MSKRATVIETLKSRVKRTTKRVCEATTTLTQGELESLICEALGVEHGSSFFWDVDCDRLEDRVRLHKVVITSEKVEELPEPEAG